MTSIQNQYWATVESRRHNVATEVQARNELDEARRHNQTWEFETKRHNVQTEKETHRSNRANEKLGRDNLKESKRHNKVTERETHRSNVANEGIKKETNAIRSREVDAKNALIAQQTEEAKRLNSLYRNHPDLMYMEHLSRIPNTPAGKAAVDAINGLYVLIDQSRPSKKSGKGSDSKLIGDRLNEAADKARKSGNWDKFTKTVKELTKNIKNSVPSVLR